MLPSLFSRSFHLSFSYILQLLLSIARLLFLWRKNVWHMSSWCSRQNMESIIDSRSNFRYNCPLFRRQHKSQCLFITTISPFAWLLLQKMYSMSTDLSLDPGFSQECAPVLEAESCWCSEASVVVSVKWAICHLGLGPAIALWNLYSFHCLNICLTSLTRAKQKEKMAFPT